MSEDPFEQALQREQELKARRSMPVIARLNTMRPRAAIVLGAAIAAVALLAAAVAALGSRSGPSSSIPNNALGDQIRFAIRLANGRVPSSQYRVHFASSFLADVPPEKIDAVNAQLAVSAPWRFDKFLARPTADSAVLLIIGAGGRLQAKVSININSTNAISALLFQPFSGSAAATALAPGLSSAASAIAAHLVAGDFAAVRARFDTTMTNGLSEDALRAAWASVTANLGSYRTAGAPIAKRIGGYETIFVPLSFQAGGIELQISFDPHQRIAGLYLRPPGFHATM